MLNDDEISRAIDNIDVNHTGFLSDQNATKEEMIKFSSSINDLRVNLYGSYIDFHVVVLENTSDAEFTSIIKEFNKVIE